MQVRHVNLNSCGRVCHSILDRNYTPETTIRTIFDCIYGVFLNPGKGTYFVSCIKAVCLCFSRRLGPARLGLGS